MRRQLFLVVVILICWATAGFGQPYYGPDYEERGPYDLACRKCIPGDGPRCSTQTKHRCRTSLYTVSHGSGFHMMAVYYSAWNGFKLVPGSMIVYGYATTGGGTMSCGIVPPFLKNPGMLILEYRASNGSVQAGCDVIMDAK
jgi:hypothetical protein